MSRKERCRPCPASDCGEPVDTWLAGTNVAMTTPSGVKHGECVDQSDWTAIYLEDMDVPDERRDLSNPDNVRWLLRNVRINNSGHINIDAVITGLRSLVKG